MNVPRLTLRQLQIFVVVAQCGSTIAASDRLSLSQSATSSAINELERMLALKLFDRVGKRLSLNGHGRSLLPRARALLDGAFSVERMADDAATQLQSFRIGASTTLGNHVLPVLLAGFLARRHSDASVWQSQVSIGNTADICSRVALFDLDIGLIEGPCYDPVLDAHSWFQDELVIVAASDGALSKMAGQARRMDLQMLRDAVWLLREPGSGTRDVTDQALLPHLHSYRRSIEMGSSVAIMHAAAAGLGLACLSRWVVNDLVESGRLCILDTPLPVFRRQCYWVCRRDKQPTLSLNEFVGYITDLRSSDICPGEPG